MRIPTEENQVDVRRGPYTLHVGYEKVGSSFEVVGVGVEKRRPAVISRERAANNVPDKIGNRYDSIEAIKSEFGGVLIW